MIIASHIIVIAIVLIAVVLMVLMLFSPHNTIVRYLFSWKYRMMLRLRDDYLWGIKKNPPDDYQYFIDSAISTISKESISHLSEARELIRMIEVERFVHHYFVEIGRFDGKVFYQMNEDFRSGRYRSFNYSCLAILEKNLPKEIVSNVKAFNDFIKFVDAGWFEKDSGMFIIDGKRNHQYIGRAIYWICKRNGIAAPEKVFGPLWNVDESKILDWKRKNKNETITDRIDAIVFQVLGK